MQKFITILKTLKLEAIIWIAALIYLVSINPYINEHYNFCLFSLAGIDFCPGCGIGRSISMLFRGDIVGSFNTHPLGIFGLLVILHRIAQLSVQTANTLKQKGVIYYGKHLRNNA